MTEPLILNKNEKPSYFNKEMAIGALLGLSTANPGLLAMGTVIGACIGQNRMAREKEYGKIIDVKTSSSKDVLLGALLGGQVGAGIAALTLHSADIPNLPLSQKAILAAAGLTGMVIGVVTGSNQGIKSYGKEHTEAVAQQQERQAGRCKTIEPEVAPSNIPTKNYSTTILAERDKSLGYLQNR